MGFLSYIRFVILLLMVMFPVGIYAQEADTDEAEDEEEEVLPESPVKLVGGDSIEVGNMNEFLIRDIALEVENRGKEAVLLKRVMSSCKCLKITEAPVAGRVEPGGKIAIKAKLDGSEIGDHYERFERRIYVECSGYQRYTIALRGHYQSVLAIKPSAILELGEFEGYNVPWSRKVTISISDKTYTEKFDVQPPPESRYFSYRLTRVKDELYELEIRPKLPLPPGKLVQEIFLRTPKIGTDRGVKMLVKGTVKGISVEMPPKEKTVYRQLEENGEQTETLVISRRKQEIQEENKAMTNFRLMTPRMQREANLYAARKQGIAKTEEDEHNKYDKALWEGFAKDFSVSCPEGITARCEATVEGLKIVLTLQKTVWGEGEVKKEVVYQRKGRKIGTTQLRLCQPNVKNEETKQEGVKPPVPVVPAP